MADTNDKPDKAPRAASPGRRELLKTGVALAVAPLFAGLSPTGPAGDAWAGPTPGAAKNVLAISASPREGGNSDMLCDAFLRGAAQAGHTTGKIRLAEHDINYCTGCLDCMGGGACSQSDDMEGISAKVLAADVLVLASPVYFMTYNGQMKTFIDRLCPIYTRISGKDLYFILSAAGGRSSIDSAVRGLRVFTGCLHGNEEKGIIASTGFWGPGRVEGTRSMREAYDRGNNV